MTVLLLGSGGREHALAWKLLQSAHCNRLLVAPGNAGTASIAENINLAPTDFEAVKNCVLQEKVDMVVVGPEDPLVKGIVDFFEQDNDLKHIPVIGPSQEGAQLEGSKDYAKQFLMRHHIPTAAYATFTAATVEEGCEFLTTLQAPYVLKADGLAAGKGVLIIADLQEAQQELRNMLVNQKFGAASARVVIEEFLSGIELSCFVLTDGKNYKLLPMAKDYKRIGEGDTGLNTGGMGAVSPVPFANADFAKKVEERIVIPTVKGLHQEQINYKGFIFIGLIKVGDDPFVIEYNVRMGDPETEVVMPRIKSDLMELFKAVAQQKLDEFELETDSRTAATVMVVSGGYPEAYEKNKPISGLDQVEESLVFHAGTQLKDNEVVTQGGRVLAITSFGDSIEEATKKSYQNIGKLHFDKMYFRKDIGLDLL
jgi:phosphoribosylamine---glycine ligase